MKIVFFFAVLVCLTACKTTKKASKNKTAQVEEVAVKQRKINAQLDDGLRESSNDTRIIAVRVEGNKLFIDINYVGDCETHNFTLLGSKTLSKSLPPIRAIKLLHTGKREICSSLIYEKIEVDISSFAYQQKEGSLVYFTLEGWNHRIEYKFSASVKNQDVPKVDANGNPTE
jgi:hypothetical protein